MTALTRRAALATTARAAIAAAAGSGFAVAAPDTPRTASTLGAARERPGARLCPTVMTIRSLVPELHRSSQRGLSALRLLAGLNRYWA